MGETSPYLTRDVVLARLREALSGTKQYSWAKALGFSAPYVCMVLRRQKRPSPRLLAALGLRRVELYQEVKDGVPTSASREPDV